MNKKELVVKYRPLVAFGCRVHNLRNVLRKKIKGNGNVIKAPCCLMKKVNIQIIGSNNTVTIGDFAILNGASIIIFGDNNTITVGGWTHLLGTELYIEDSGSTISVGEKSRILGKTHLAAIEGTNIQIGRDCLFSSDIHFRTGDSHSILDMQGRRINASKDITVGDHVWIGTKVTCLKGAKIADHSIVGACAVVSGAFDKPHCALAGVPARVVKEGVDWSITRIPIGETAADFDPVI